MHSDDVQLENFYAQLIVNRSKNILDELFGKEVISNVANTEKHIYISGRIVLDAISVSYQEKNLKDEESAVPYIIFLIPNEVMMHYNAYNDIIKSYKMLNERSFRIELKENNNCKFQKNINNCVIDIFNYPDSEDSYADMMNITHNNYKSVLFSNIIFNYSKKYLCGNQDILNAFAECFKSNVLISPNEYFEWTEDDKTLLSDNGIQLAK